jgi:6-phosphofructokinase 2
MHKVRTRGQLHHPGGGGANVARVIAELGGEAELAFLCGGVTGPLYEALLAGYGLKLRCFEMAGPVRISYTVREEATGQEYRFVPEGPAVSEAELAPLMQFIADFRGDFMVASGSLPRGVDPAIYARMAKIAKRNHVRFVLDTSGDALRAALAAGGIFLVKPSQRELEEIAGRPLDREGVEREATALVSSGAARHVVVSLGGQGALLANEEGVAHLPAIVVKAKSAVGAGDSFLGGMVHWLAEGHAPAEAFRFAMAAGAAAVLHEGTSLCRRDDVMRLYRAMPPV